MNLTSNESKRMHAEMSLAQRLQEVQQRYNLPLLLGNGDSNSNSNSMEEEQGANVLSVQPKETKRMDTNSKEQLRMPGFRELCPEMDALLQEQANCAGDTSVPLNQFNFDLQDRFTYEGTNELQLVLAATGAEDAARLGFLDILMPREGIKYTVTSKVALRAPEKTRRGGNMPEPHFVVIRIEFPEYTESHSLLAVVYPASYQVYLFDPNKHKGMHDWREGLHDALTNEVIKQLETVTGDKYEPLGNVFACPLYNNVRSSDTLRYNTKGPQSLMPKDSRLVCWLWQLLTLTTLYRCPQVLPRDWMGYWQRQSTDVTAIALRRFACFLAMVGEQSFVDLAVTLTNAAVRKKLPFASELERMFRDGYSAVNIVGVFQQEAKRRSETEHADTIDKIVQKNRQRLDAYEAYRKETGQPRLEYQRSIYSSDDTKQGPQASMDLIYIPDSFRYDIQAVQVGNAIRGAQEKYTYGHPYGHLWQITQDSILTPDFDVKDLRQLLQDWYWEDDNATHPQVDALWRDLTLPGKSELGQIAFLHDALQKFNVRVVEVDKKMYSEDGTNGFIMPALPSTNPVRPQPYEFIAKSACRAYLSNNDIWLVVDDTTLGWAKEMWARVDGENYTVGFVQGYMHATDEDRIRSKTNDLFSGFVDIYKKLDGSAKERVSIQVQARDALRAIQEIKELAEPWKDFKQVEKWTKTIFNDNKTLQQFVIRCFSGDLAKWQDMKLMQHHWGNLTNASAHHDDGKRIDQRPLAFAYVVDMEERWDPFCWQYRHKMNGDSIFRQGHRRSPYPVLDSPTEWKSADFETLWFRHPVVTYNQATQLARSVTDQKKIEAAKLEAAKLEEEVAEPIKKKKKRTKPIPERSPLDMRFIQIIHRFLGRYDSNPMMSHFVAFKYGSEQV